MPRPAGVIFFTRPSGARDVLRTEVFRKRRNQSLLLFINTSAGGNSPEGLIIMRPLGRSLEFQFWRYAHPVCHAARPSAACVFQSRCTFRQLCDQLPALIRRQRRPARNFTTSAKAANTYPRVRMDHADINARAVHLVALPYIVLHVAPFR